MTRVQTAVARLEARKVLPRPMLRDGAPGTRVSRKTEAVVRRHKDVVGL